MLNSNTLCNLIVTQLSYHVHYLTSTLFIYKKQEASNFLIMINPYISLRCRPLTPNVPVNSNVS